MGTVWSQPCARLGTGRMRLVVFCATLYPSLVHGLVFDPFRSLLLSLQGSVGNQTEDAANQTWVESFHKIISATEVTPNSTVTATEVTVSAIPLRTATEVTPTSTVSGIPVRSSAQARAAALLKEKLDRFVPVSLQPDYDFLTESERSVLVHLVKAAEQMDPVYERQVWAQNPSRRAELAGQDTALSRVQLEYMDIMRGPWDRYSKDKPFAIDRQKPLGAGLYPEDMTETQLQFYLGSHPEKRGELESEVTVVRSQQQAAVYPVPLYGVPYSTEYAEWLEQAARHLKEAEIATDDESLKTFLASRSKALLTDDYSESDTDWLDIKSRVQTAIGPYRAGEDKLKGLKKSFEAIVYILEQTFKPQFRTLIPETRTAYAQLIPQLEADLPVPEEVKNKSPPKTSIDVAELVFASGSARKYPQLFSFTFPTNKTIIAEKGERKIVMSNVIYAFYKEILTKISENIMKSKQRKLLDEDAFFMIVLYHEISHSLGPVYVGNNETRGSLKEVFGASYAPLEDAKAGALGAFNVLRKITKEPKAQPDFKNKVLFTYITYLLQLVRDADIRPEGSGAAIQLNRFLEDGSIALLESPNPDAGNYQVNFKKLETSLNKLVTDLIVLQHKGEKEAAIEMVEKYGALGPKLKEVKDALENIPVDIRPVFKSANTY